MINHLLFTADPNPFLVRAFASYARLGPSADRRRTEVLRGSAGRPVTQQMNKRTTKNDQNRVNMQNKPNLRKTQMNAKPVPKETYGELPLRLHPQNKPKQTQFKANFKPAPTPASPFCFSLVLTTAIISPCRTGQYKNSLTGRWTTLPKRASTAPA